MEASARSRLWSRCKSRATAYYRALTRDFNYSTDFFFGQDFLMAIAGARLNSTNVRIRRWWNAYRAGGFLEHFCDGAKSREAGNCTELRAGNGWNGVTMLRMMIILWHYDSLMEVRRYVNRRKFGKNLQLSLGIRSEAFYHIRKIVFISTTVILTVMTSFLAVDFSDHHYFKIPFIEQFGTVVQKLCQKALNLAFYGVGVMTVFVYLFPYTILNGMMSELKVLAQAFSVVFDNTEMRVQRKLELEPGNSRQQDLMKKRFFWKFVQEEFALLNRIRPFLNATFLIVYYSTVMSLSSGAIYVSQMENVTIFSLNTLYYCVWVAFECGTLTRTVSLLTESQESIGWEVYNLDWPEKLEWDDQFQEEYRSVRATMLNVMIVAQQPLGLNCYGFFEFTQDRFYELLNMAYSVYTFFRDFV
ncbi:Odorant receptor 7a [Culex quinquefasciatus]|uniref:Odorant receptor 7a n=1 Tax=Culex quinquefasciatus TaxID=7176 RepID=B0XCZ0_CULQU|nr:Odorant receptor 7a [Culex quinquefasciatus]|eukprot:XP_001867512.1 Odorant receptor 7a [Culex quinquefasciatus]